jgi:tetratricopeptide (TPR) repeat protein
MAASYWRWHGKLQRSPGRVEDLLEARYHHDAAGELDEAVAVTEAICSYLDAWGAWDWEQALLLETLAWLPERSANAADFHHQLGLVAQHRRDFDPARSWYQQSLAIFKQLGDAAGVAKCYLHLSFLAGEQGNHGAALNLTRRALRACRRISEVAGVAGRARCYHQVGKVLHAHHRHQAAYAWYQNALTIFKQLSDQAGIGACYGQLGVLAAERDEPEEALRMFKKALAIFKSRGDRVSMAETYCQIGKLYTMIGDALNGLHYQVQSISLRFDIGYSDIAFDVYYLYRQREMLGEKNFHDLLIRYLGEDRAAAIEQWLREKKTRR